MTLTIVGPARRPPELHRRREHDEDRLAPGLGF
jgi:hypothetical protein